MTMKSVLVSALSMLIWNASCCCPETYNGHVGQQFIHDIDAARVFPDCLSIQGTWNRPWAVYNYGVKVLSALDDTGKQLKFNGLQFNYLKEMIFEMTFSKPSPGAKSVSIDVMFYRGGKTERITKTLQLETGSRGYRSMRSRFETAPTVWPQYENAKSK